MIFSYYKGKGKERKKIVKQIYDMAIFLPYM